MNVVDKQDCNQDNHIHEITGVENNMPRCEKGRIHPAMSMCPPVEVEAADKDHAEEAHDQVEAQAADRPFFVCHCGRLLPRCQHGFCHRDAPPFFLLVKVLLPLANILHYTICSLTYVASYYVAADLQLTLSLDRAKENG